MAWLKDYADPQPMLQPVFDGVAIRPSGNTNYSELDDPAINAAMAAAAVLPGRPATGPGGPSTADLRTAAAIPLQWDITTLIRSKDVDGVANATFGSWDLSYISLK